MIQSAITVSLVEEARGGPFVFWDGLEDAFQQAAKLGFDAIEIFAPGPDAVERDTLSELVEQYGLAVAAVGTGAGMVKHGLSLTHPDAEHRRQAVEFVNSMIEFGGAYGAPAIIGSMQGKWGGEVDYNTALKYLAESLEQLGEYAAKFEVPLLYEPLNRYETNLLKTIGDSVDFLKQLPDGNIKLLADLFHMNIEEASLESAIRASEGHIGHVHFVDSNRHAAGYGHTDFGPIADALKEIGFEGYLSAEAFPAPDSSLAASKTIETFQRFFR